jgi:hypothetical protein
MQVNVGSLAAPQGFYAALRLLPVSEDSGLASFWAFVLAADSCFTLRAIASVFTCALVSPRRLNCQPG